MSFNRALEFFHISQFYLHLFLKTSLLWGYSPLSRNAVVFWVGLYQKRLPHLSAGLGAVCSHRYWNVCLPSRPCWWDASPWQWRMLGPQEEGAGLPVPVVLGQISASRTLGSPSDHRPQLPVPDTPAVFRVPHASLESLFQQITLESALPVGYRGENWTRLSSWFTISTPLWSACGLLIYLSVSHKIHSPNAML